MPLGGSQYKRTRNGILVSVVIIIILVYLYTNKLKSYSQHRRLITQQNKKTVTDMRARTKRHQNDTTTSIVKTNRDNGTRAPLSNLRKEDEISIVRKFARRWKRDRIGALLSQLKVESAVELGVKQGHFAEKVLHQCTTCQKYILVDLWKQQENYKDVANVADGKQLAYKNEALARTNKFRYGGVDVICMHMSTVQAASEVSNTSVDFLYVDARHDYCGILEDLIAWWPKMKRTGSIVAGHDFLYANASQLKGQDWGLCADGTRNVGAVKGAVLDFFKRHDGVVGPFVSNERWPSWMYYVIQS